MSCLQAPLSVIGTKIGIIGNHSFEFRLCDIYASTIVKQTIKRSVKLSITIGCFTYNTSNLRKYFGIRLINLIT